MTSFSQETDSKIKHDMFPEHDRIFVPSDLTAGIDEPTESFPLLGESNPVREAKSIVSKIKDKHVTEQADKLLSTINMMVKLVQQIRNDYDIPPLHAHVDDGSVLLEWIFPDFRVGFNIEPNPDDSGWHLVSNKKLNEITASGQLANMDEIVNFLLNFIFANI